MPNVGILALPGANIHAVDYWLKRSGAKSSFVATSSEMDKTDCLLLPGVGSFDVAINHIESAGLRASILRYAESGRHLLGICLGMQIMFDSSDEGDCEGLSLMRGHVRRIPAGNERVPNIGWRQVAQRMGCGKGPAQQYFFMHSYGVLVDDVLQNTAVSAVESVSCNVELVASFRCGNVIGFQYHPEKSYSAGDRLLKEVLDEI